MIGSGTLFNSETMLQTSSSARISSFFLSVFSRNVAGIVGLAWSPARTTFCGSRTTSIAVLNDEAQGVLIQKKLASKVNSFASAHSDAAAYLLFMVAKVKLDTIGHNASPFSLIAVEQNMALNPVKSRLADTLGVGNSEKSFPAKRFRQDMQGWNSHHAFLTEAIQNVRPEVVIEIGVWKGGSTIRMAQKIKELGIDATVIAIDTWLGSWEHYEQPEFFSDLLFDHGYPSLYYTFMTNVVECGVEDYVIPLPLDSANAAIVIERKNIVPDVVHIDGGHDYQAVVDDMTRWWKIIRPGGMLIMDDYDKEGVVWPTVRDAVNDFCARNHHQSFEAVPYKARLTKPLSNKE